VTTRTGCVFCLRVRGEDHWIPVLETEHTIAAVSNHQRSPGCLTIIPRRHVASIAELSEAEALDWHRVVRSIWRATDVAHTPDAVHFWQGGRLFDETGRPHVHGRLCPRYADVEYTFVPNYELPLWSEAERQAIAERLIPEATRWLELERSMQGEVIAESDIPYAFDRPDADGCALCATLAEGPAHEIAAVDAGVAFVASRQPFVGTTLVVPRRHVLHPLQLQPREAQELFLLLRRLLVATDRAFECPSHQFNMYVGSLTDEPVSHLHYRVEPRYDKPPSTYTPIAQLPKVDPGLRATQAQALRGALPA